jgi:hypothetical protein
MHCEHTTCCVRPICTPQLPLLFAASGLTHPGDQLQDSYSLIPGLNLREPVSQTSSSNAVPHRIVVVSEDGQVRNVDGALDTEVENGPEITADEIFNSPDIEIELQEDEIHDSVFYIALSISAASANTMPYDQNMPTRNLI